MTPEMRGVVLDRAIGLCELCGRPAHHVHHVSYPKARDGEHPDNLLAVCADCHSRLHGVRTVEANPLVDGKVRQVKDIMGNDMRIVESERVGDVFNTPERWVASMYAPEHLHSYTVSRVTTEAYACDARGKSGTAMYQGKPVVSSRAVIQGLSYLRFLMAEKGHTVHAITTLQRQAEQEFAPKIMELQDYFHDLALEMLEVRRTGVLSVVASPSSSSSQVEQAIMLLSSLTADHHNVLDDHGKRITMIEQSRHDKHEDVTIGEACLETAQDQYTKTKPGCGWNLAQMAADELKKKGVAPTGKKLTRFHNSSLERSMNTYPRGAVYGVLGALVQKDFSHLLRD